MPVNSPRLTAFLMVLILAALCLFLTPFVQTPGRNNGYSPQQPIAFSHRLHAGMLQINCQYCHFTAERGPHAGFPAVATCLNCHRFVKGSTPYNQSQIQKLYYYAGLDANGNPDPHLKPQPIPWIKIHVLPAFVRFDHSRHITQGVTCQTCHGPIQTMEQVTQYSTLAMGFCINCHRNVDADGLHGKKVHASLDCAVCHY
ncbi:MAG TPA: cytochrome c3 family protein [bacterium]|jgi:hypothetical protein|nr:cytochrome c3 family protein [bacterium]